MKKLIYILIFGALHLSGFAQSRLQNPAGTRDGNSPDISHRDSVKTPNIPHFRKTWQWRHDGVYTEDIPLDTTLDNAHNYNYIFRKSIANTYLANFPSPYISDIYIERAKEEDFYPLTNIRAYLFKPVDALNFNTTTPFTQLTYKTGGGKGKNETFLDIWHSQNIRPYWNAGFRYNLISSDGRYMNQKSKAYNVSFFSSYEYERWVVNFFINQNNGKFNENGGIVDKKYIRDTTINAENIPVNLSNTTNSYRNFNFYTQVQYNIGKEKEVARSKDTTITYPAKAILAVKVEDNVHRFKEASVNRDFFPHTYLDTIKSADMQSNRLYNLSSKFVVNEHPKYKYLPGIYAGLDFEYLDYTGRTSLDTINNRGKDLYTGTWLTGGLFNVDTTALFNFDAAVRLCLLGDYIGNFTVEGFLRQYLRKDRSSYIRVDASIESKTVNPFFSRYIGNHDYWENNFSNIKTFSVEGRYINERSRTELGVGWNNTIDYVYFDTAAMPVQSSKNLMVLTLWGKQKFKAGNFHFDQTVYVQKSTQEDVLSLPTVALYSHNYYQNAFFKKVLKFVIGIDLFYNTKFYADKYQPSSMQFYNQREEKTGGYPKVDVFLDFGIKRAHLFLKYEHVNYFITNGEYFSALDYPINPGMFKFGLSWNFFD
ncbi:putative porin [Culturomica massiliensis]|uniref:putative porin n=1 Tax=Culturomica massiliensis TaxID=1841857 RepID=UPI003AB84A04